MNKSKTQRAENGATLERYGFLFSRFGLWSACLAGVVFGSLGRAPWAGAGLFCVLGALAMWDPKALERLYAPKFWVTAAILALTVGAFAGSRDSVLCGVPYSEAGLEAGFVLLCRAAVLFCVAVVISRRISHRSMIRLTGRLGFPRFGAALGLAINATPLLVDSARESAGILRIRLSRKGSFIQRIERLFLVLLVRAEQLAVEAAWLDGLKIAAVSVSVDEVCKQNEDGAPLSTSGGIETGQDGRSCR